jgi:hypothetical protein
MLELTDNEARRLLSQQDMNGGARGKYDWDSILNGNWNVLIYQEDFHCKATAFRERIYTIANSRGLKANVYEVRTPKQGWLVRAYEPDPLD